MIAKSIYKNIAKVTRGQLTIQSFVKELVNTNSNSPEASGGCSSTKNKISSSCVEGQSGQYSLNDSCEKNRTSVYRNYFDWFVILTHEKFMSSAFKKVTKRIRCI
jgi:hypothetical protein